MKLEDFSPPLTEKERAIASVLPLLHDHLDLICPIRSCLGHLTPESPHPPRIYQEDEEALWVRIRDKNRRRYRLDAIARSIDRLYNSNLPQAHDLVNALYCTFIEPFDRYLTREQRLYWARCALGFMAKEIPGEIPVHEFRPPSTKDRRDARDAEIRRLLASGLTTRAVARELGCSTATIQAVRNGRSVLHGRVAKPPTHPTSPSTVRSPRETRPRDTGSLVAHQEASGRG